MNSIRDALWLAFVFAGLLTEPVYAWQWQNIWKTQDQRAKVMMKTGDYAKAADTFQRPDWRATAAFRAGDYQRAAREYAQLGTADGHYNAGNALAKIGQYPQAIAQYDQALAMNAQHEDAAYNRQLVQALLDQQKPQDQDNQNSKQQDKESQEKNAGKQNPSPSQSNQNDPSKPQQSPAPEKKQQHPVKQPPPKKADPKKTKLTDKDKDQSAQAPMTRAEREQQKANEQWLQLIPDDPGGLLREKFMRDHLKKRGEWQS